MGFSANSIKTQNCDKGIKDFEKKNVNRQVLGETGKEARKNKQTNSGGLFRFTFFGRGRLWDIFGAHKRYFPVLSRPTLYTLHRQKV